MSDANNRVEWHRDPAASGWRSRAWLDGGWELLAYDNGQWEVRKGFAVACGNEADGETAKRRCLKIHSALVESVVEPT